MIARPVVAGPLAGLVLGDPLQGAVVGSVLEILTLHQLPIGASRTWDTGPAAVAAVAALAASAGGVTELVVAVGLGAIIGWAGGWSVHALRHVNSRLVVVEGSEVPPARLAGGHLAAMCLDFGRGVALTAIGVLVARAVAGAEASTSSAVWAARAVVVASVSLALGAAIRAVAGGRGVWRAFAAAVGLSAIVTIWLV